MDVGVGVGVAVGVGVGVGVAVDVDVGVKVGVGVEDDVGVGVGLGVAVDDVVGVGVGVEVGDRWGVGVGVGVDVLSQFHVEVSVGVGVSVPNLNTGSSVGVGVPVGVSHMSGVGDGVVPLLLVVVGAVPPGTGVVVDWPEFDPVSVPPVGVSLPPWDWPGVGGPSMDSFRPETAGTPAMPPPGNPTTTERPTRNNSAPATNNVHCTADSSLIVASTDRHAPGVIRTASSEAVLEA